MSRPSDRPTGSSFLENLAHLVPGYQGYRFKEQRRDEDSRLRSILLQRLSAIRGTLMQTVTTAAEDPSGLCAETLDREAIRLDGIADAIRYAPYGFSGFFDVAAIREDALDRILEADLLLIDDLREIERVADRIPPRPRMNARFYDSVAQLEDRIRSLERHLIMRDKLLGDV